MVRPRPVRGKGFFEVRVRSRVLYDVLRKPIGVDGIKPFVEHSEDCVRSFLRGFFDSEGCVNRYDGGVYCFNSDKQPIEYVQRLLHSLGIETRGPYLMTRKGGPLFNREMGKIYVKKKDVYCLYIRGPYRLRFYQLIGFTIRRKKQRLEEYLRRRGLLKTPPIQPSPNSFPPFRAHSVKNIRCAAAGI